MRFESAGQEAQAALDHFGFLVIAYTNTEDAEKDLSAGITTGPTFSKDHGSILINGVVIGRATVDDWRAQEKFYGDEPAYIYRSFLKVIAE